MHATSTAQVALLANATAAGSETAAQCHPDACADNLMFEGPKGQPGCGMRAVSTSLASMGTQAWSDWEAHGSTARHHLLVLPRLGILGCSTLSRGGH